MLVMSLQQCPNSAVQNLFSNFNPAMCFASERTNDQQAMLKFLSNESFDSLTYGKDRNVALNLFSTITKEKFLSLDCPSLNRIWRNTMMLVHPDKVSRRDAKIAKQAAANLIQARDTLGCRHYFR